MWQEWPPKEKLTSLKKDDNKNNTNAVTKDVQDALLSSVYSPVNSWVLDSGVSIHVIANHDLFENYVPVNYCNGFLADGKPLELVRVMFG